MENGAADSKIRYPTVESWSRLPRMSSRLMTSVPRPKRVA